MPNCWVWQNLYRHSGSAPISYLANEENHACFVLKRSPKRHKVMWDSQQTRLRCQNDLRLY